MRRASARSRESLCLRAEPTDSANVALHPTLVEEWTNWIYKGLYERDEEDEKKREEEKNKKKMMTDRATGIVVIPHWTSQPWFPLFSKLLTEKPLLFKPPPTLVLSPCRSIQHPLAKKLSLMVGKLSGNLLKREDCLYRP
ncbi:hypothetical protein ALC57_15612 [Trachymyrmex cornetzi]|uniref:Uncharacterized protein n=1 Tax=Trachymyrmex cornetzi TaxID=471704 RepID=A0A151IWL5_9HYME|nr:hypothetical protein ALC57_15612 [Trachymyrmex cornetzi]